MNKLSDREYLQGLLDHTGELRILPKLDGTPYEIDQPLVLSSGSHIILDGCTLRLCDNVYSNIFISRGAWDSEPRELYDISITGVNATLDGGNPNGLTEKTAFSDGRPNVLNNTLILLRNVDGFRISGLRLENPRYWGMTFYYCSHGEISDIEFTARNTMPNQDGIDLRRGCHDITIRDISGSTGDDTVALTALNNKSEHCFEISSKCRDIHDVTIRGINTDVTGGHGVVRLLCHDTIKLYNVTICDIYDRHVDCGDIRNQAAVRIGDERYFTVSPAVTGDMHNITVSRVITNAKIPVKIHGEIPNLELSEITNIL